MNFYDKKKQSKMQKIFLIVLVAMLSIGLLLPSFMSILAYIEIEHKKCTRDAGCHPLQQCCNICSAEYLIICKAKLMVCKPQIIK